MTLQPPSNSLGEAAQLIAHRLRRPPLSPFAIGLVAGSVDFIAITLAAWFARYAAEPLLPSGLSGVAWSIATGLLAVAILGASSAYRIAALRRLALGAACAAGVGARFFRGRRRQGGRWLEFGGDEPRWAVQQVWHAVGMRGRTRHTWRRARARA